MFQDTLYVIVHRQVILVVEGLRGGANDLSGERKVSNLLAIALYRYFTGACFELLKRTQKCILPFDINQFTEVSSEHESMSQRNVWLVYLNCTPGGHIL